MRSIARLSRTVRTRFEEDAVALAKQAGMRQRTMSFTQLASLWGLGWWKQPQAGPSALSRFAGSRAVQIDKQTVDCHLTERTAPWLLALLPRVVAQVVCAREIAVPLVQPFKAVFVEEGRTISLPSALQSVWQGCGGSASRPGKDGKTQAALKLTLRWELLHGQVPGPFLPEGRRHELASWWHAHQMAAGSWWIADLGYWTLKWLHQGAEQGVFFLMRYKVGTVLWLNHERLDLLSVLPEVVGERLELVVDVGASKGVKGVRVLAERVPAEVARQRQERIAQYASDHSEPINPLVWELAHWTLLVSNVAVACFPVSRAWPSCGPAGKSSCSSSGGKRTACWISGTAASRGISSVRSMPS